MSGWAVAGLDRECGMIPTRKVNAGGITASLAVVIAWSAKEFWQVEVPTEIGIAFAGILTYVIQYLVPDK